MQRLIYKILLETIFLHFKAFESNLFFFFVFFSKFNKLAQNGKSLDIENICFFEVNTKYISSSELKTSEFSRVRSTSENFYVVNSRDEIYLVFTEKKQF